MDLPSNFRLQYDSTAIAKAVHSLGEEITSWAQEVWADSQKDIIGIPVLRGGIFFYADLVRHINHSVECAPVRTWAYEVDQTGVMLNSVKLSLEGVEPEGRSVLLIDDICDSGRTLHALTEAFLKAGAKEVKAAVLIRRAMEHETFDPQYVGFEYQGEEWFVGYGMEDKERYRNLDSIYIIEKE